MNWGMGLRVFLLLGLGWGSIDGARADSAYVPEYVRVARELDRAAGYLPQRKSFGGHRTKLGLQIHPYCFDQLRWQGISREQAEKNINEWVDSSVSALLVDCRAKYSELEPYFKSWVSHAIRSVVTCADKESKELPFGAINASLGAVADFYLSASAKAGLEDIYPLRPLSRLHKDVVVLPKDRMRLIANWSKQDEDTKTSLRDTLIHEFLHSTASNNLGALEHWLVEKKAFSSKQKGCPKNITMDRVSVVAKLCSKSTGHTDGLVMAEALAERMKNDRCGIEKGCVEIFREDPGFYNPFVDRYLPTLGLSPADALSLCKKVQEEGDCVSNAKAAPQGDSPELIAIGQELSSRLNEILPRSPLQLPLKLMEAYPNVLKRLRGYQGTPCLDTLGYWGTDGNFYFREKSSNETLISYSERADGNRMLRTMWNLENRVKDLPQCETAEQGKDAIATLNWMVTSISTGLGADAFHELIERRASGKKEKRLAPSYADARQIEANGHLRVLMGESLDGRSLFDRYLDALKKNNNKSPRFCLAPGTSYYSAAVDAAKMLDCVATSMIPPACPE